MTTQVCTKCGKEKPIDMFHKRKETMTGRKYEAERCKNIREGLKGRKATAEQRAKRSEFSKGTGNPRAKAVVQYSLAGEIIAEFVTVTEATKAMNGSSTSHISNVCNGKKTTAYNFIWKYKEK